MVSDKNSPCGDRKDRLCGGIRGRRGVLRVVYQSNGDAFVLSTNILNSSGRGAHGPSGRFPVYMAVGDRKTRPRSTEMTYRALC